MTLMPDDGHPIQYAASAAGTVVWSEAGMSTLLGPEGPGMSLNLGLHPPAPAARQSERRRRGGVGLILVERPAVRYATSPGRIPPVP